MARTSTTPAAAAPDERDITITALARAVCLLAVRQPGGPASLQRILTGDLGLSHAHAGAIIAAAERPAGG